METKIQEFTVILNEEEKVLNELSAKQELVKEAVVEREWEKLVNLIYQVNKLSDTFRVLDERRDDIQVSFDSETLKPFYEKLGALRSLLLKCKVENRVLNDYVNIAKNFVQEVVEKALPQTRNKNYSRTGHMVQPQPVSVVVNQLF